MSRSRKVGGLVALMVALAGAAYLAVRAHLERGVVEFSNQAKVVAHQLTATTDSISTSGVDQRYRMRRDAVASMRADLMRLVALESTFVADSGFPRASFNPYSEPRYMPVITKGNLLNGITLSNEGWTATIISTTTTTITCSIHVPYSIDTTARPPRFVLSPAPVEPVCKQPK